jgi:TldD protein
MYLKDFIDYFKEKVELLEKYYLSASFFSQYIDQSSFLSSTKDSKTYYYPSKSGFVAKAFNGKYFQEYASSEISFKSIDQATKYLIDNIDYCEKEFDLKVDNRIMISNFAHKSKIRASDVSAEEYIKIAEKSRTFIETMSNKISYVDLSLGYLESCELYVNRYKTLFQELSRFDVYYNIVFKDGDKRSEIHDGYSKIGGFEHAGIDLNLVKKSVEDGESILYSKKLEPGYYDCIFSPSLSGMLAHEAFGHGSESDTFLKDRAKAKDFIGKRVGNKKLNLWDSPNMNSNEYANGSYFFDNEGVIAKSTQIVKDGIFIAPITDLYSGSKQNYTITANSRAELYQNKVYARMSNTYFDRGSDKLDDMMAKIKYGFLIDRATNGMEDPKSWGVQIEALIAREIVNGKLTKNIFSPVIISGSLITILSSVTDVSEDFEIASLGYCGKGHKEWVKVTDGGPYIKLKCNLS